MTMGYDQRPNDQGAQGGDNRDPTIAADKHSDTVKLTILGGDTARVALFLAIAKASAEFTPVVNDTNAMIGRRDYKYASLDRLVAATRPALSKHEIAVLQLMTGPHENGVHRLTTIVAGHGAEIHSAIDYMRAPEIKTWGSQTTYLRRYAYRAAFQLDGSDDADSTDVNPTMDRPMGKTQGAPPEAKKPEQKPKVENAGLMNSRGQQDQQTQTRQQGQAVAGQLGLVASSNQQQAASQGQASQPPGPTPAEVEATYKRAEAGKALAEERAEAAAAEAKGASVPPPVPHDQETGEVDGPITKATLEAMRAATKSAKGPDGVAQRFAGKDDISQWVMATFNVMPSQITELIGRQIILRLNEGT